MHCVHRKNFTLWTEFKKQNFTTVCTEFTIKCTEFKSSPPCAQNSRTKIYNRVHKIQATAKKFTTMCIEFTSVPPCAQNSRKNFTTVCTEFTSLPPCAQNSQVYHHVHRIHKFTTMCTEFKKQNLTTVCTSELKHQKIKANTKKRESLQLCAQNRGGEIGGAGGA